MQQLRQVLEKCKERCLQTQQELAMIKEQINQILNKLIKMSSYQMRNCIMNQIANQMRYPNTITYFFLTFVIKQFLEPNNDMVQE